MRAMQGPAQNEHANTDEPAGYETPAIEARESLSDPLIGVTSTGMMLGSV
jgi:hypothetical protein